MSNDGTSMKRLAELRTQRKAAKVMTRTAAVGQATFWFEVGSARNLTVKEYEDPNMGESGIMGKFELRGTLHIKPKGAVWSAQFPVNHHVHVSQHASSGNYVFSPEERDSTGELLGMALMDYAVEDAIRKALGKLVYVPYGKTAEIVSPPPVIVGDIFYSSWGYDQTNVDYYQVTRTSGSMIEIRQVNKKVTRGLGQPTEFVIPLANQFIGPALRKKILVHSGRALVKLNSYSSAYKWDGREQGQTGGSYGH